MTAPEAISRAALSVDVEDYFQVEVMRELCPRSAWDRFEDRTVANTERLLRIAAERGARATFFVLGWCAERHPDLVRRIASEGHEIASHGYDHELIYNQTPDEFREDVRRAKRLLEDLAGREVVGYRAPSYTIVERTRWALPILVEEGYRYDSSIFPIRRRRYGWPDAPSLPHRIQVADGRFIAEFPMPTLRVGPIRLPTTGGAYLRLLPFSFQKWWVRDAVKRARPFVMNIHPWEIDPGQPRLPVGRRIRVTHYHGQAHAARRLSALLALGAYRSVADVLQAMGLMEGTGDSRTPDSTDFSAGRDGVAR